MLAIKQVKPLFLHFVFVAFNRDAVRKAYMLRLFSAEFCLGCACSAVSAGILLLHMLAHLSLPGWFLVPITLISVFTGCCWVAFPLFVYLARKGDRLLARQITPGRLTNALTGVSLCLRAARGRLTLQFFGAIFLDIVAIWLLLHWSFSASWQALFHLLFFINTVFYIALPLLLFLGCWLQRGIRKAIC